MSQAGRMGAAPPSPIVVRPAKRRHGLARILHLTLGGLVLAGIVHLVAVLIVPGLALRDAATVYGALGAAGRAEPIAPPAGPEVPALPDADPATVVTACGFDLSAGPFRVVARTGVLPLGLTVHRRGGGVLYAITDRAAVRGIVEFVLMTEAQLDERLARDEEGESLRELRVVSPSPQGLVVARALARLPSDQAEAAALAGNVACGLAE